MIGEHRYDVVIVGAGGAGMRAAVEAGPRARTAVLTKLYPTRSHTGAAQGGMCAALANVEEDNWEWHTFDTVKGGDYLADQDAVEIMCKEAIDAVLDLEKMGMPFNRTPEGRIDQRRFGGHTRDHGKAPVRRACYAADRTGHMILQTLYQNCVKHDVEFFNEFYALDIAMTETAGGPVATGVIAYELATGDIHVFHAKAIVFATGGSGRMYKTTSNAHTLTGDGLGIVFGKGLPLEDMEFHQFHPTGLAGLGILISEAVRGEGGRLLNGDGERFMERYAPTIVDLAPRDIVARSMVLEVLEGRGAGPHKDYVYIDVRHLGADVLEAKLPDITEFARTYLGVDPVTELVPVYPTCHYVMGGIPTTITGKCCATTPPWCPACTRPASARVCRCTAPTGWAPTRCWTSTCSAVAPASPRPTTRWDTTTSPCRPTRPPWWSLGRRDPLRARQRARRRHPRRPATVDGQQRRGVPHRGNTQAGADRYPRAQGALRPNHGARQRQTLQQRPAGSDRAGLFARTCRGDGGRRPQPQGVPRRACPRGLPQPRRHQLHAPHHGLQAGHRSAQSDIRLDYKPVVQTRYQPMERKY